MGSVDDIQQLCRLCLIKDQVNIPIFDETSDIRQIFLKINSCLPVKVSRDDNLPKKICDGCSYKLDMLYIFRNTSVDSEKQLIAWLNQAGLAPKDGATKPEVMVKQETFESGDARLDDGEEMEGEQEMGVDSYIMQQQKLPYQQEFAFGEPSGSASGLADEPVAKRAKRSVKKQVPLETDDDDELDAAMQITKAEEDDSDEVDQPDYIEAPSTSADDQPGPSGVGKGTIEAPLDGIVKTEPTVESPEPETSKYSCKLCQIIFPTYIMLKKHRYKQHTPHDRYTCPECNKKFKERYRLKLHREIHSKETLYQCTICEEKLKTYSQLFFHKRKHLNPHQKFTCSECSRVFRSYSSFKEHVDSHKGVQYECSICHQSFRTKYIMNYHKKTHETGHGEKSFTCETCGKSFKTDNSLKKHVRKMHIGERHLCEVCGKALMSAASLRDHRLIHTGEKPFSCNHCGKKFGRKQHLTDHVRVHTKEKPFECKFCDKKYSQKTPLTLHVRSVHDGEKPYACLVCSKRFVSNALLQTHVRSHSVKNV